VISAGRLDLAAESLGLLPKIEKDKGERNPADEKSDSLN